VADLFHATNHVGTFTGFVDPPSAGSEAKTDIDWQKWKNRLKKVAKKVAQGAAIFVIGAWCALMTFAWGLLAVAGAASGWVLLIGILGVLFFGGLCAVLLWIVSQF
jgi:hypothetical protein